MIISLGDVSQFGVIRDVAPHELPFLAWSDASNVRFRDGAVERVGGQLAVMGAPAIEPYYLFPYADGINLTWVYPGLNKVYAWQGGAHVNLTRQTTGADVDYAATPDRNWTHCVLGGIPILNNGIDAPQMWLQPTLSQPLQELSNWPANSRCSSMRAYKNFLVALDVTKTGTRYPYMVKWSTPADPGFVPMSWDELDTTNLSGEWSISDSLDFVVDCIPLRDTNIIYKEQTTHAMQYIGGNYVFRFSKLFDHFGCFSRRCVAEFFGKHFVFSLDDIVVHDGVQAESILTRRWRRWLQSNIDPTYYKRAFVTGSQRLDELWACFPTIGSTMPNVAIIWNHRTNTLSVRDIAELSHIHFGSLDASSSSGTWSGDSAAWQTDTTAWDDATYNPTLREFGAARPDSTMLAQIEAGYTEFGNPYSAFVERIGMGIPLRKGDPPDVSSRKFCNRIWPRISGTTGATVLIKVGSQNELNGPNTWQDARPYTIGSNAPIDVRLSGKLFSLRIESTASAFWRFHGAEIDVSRGGLY